MNDVDYKLSLLINYNWFRHLVQYICIYVGIGVPKYTY